eukprot:CAMPEP_0117649494 /NCGR_PEP_ID=MMETSP0804-20121206/1002_1 /TAXON_ID=1074897 /ORGANISM="Tetraselmis astigmatica, Strain CCMP880" /LENGTH=253 /DNA_ID=CAMNT_0005455235 /DNA_START=389 /DNA_END=1149 /DNA_ORIENTATION=-
MVKPQYEELKEVALFLPQPGSLDPSMGIGLYVSVGGSDWSYRGCVTVAHPSDVMPLEWPKNTSGGPAAAQIGIAVEPAAELMGKEGSKLGAREDFAKRVAMDLFNFMQSFSQAAAGGNIIVPTNCIDRWFTKFSHKFRVDPDFLTREKDKIDHLQLAGTPPQLTLRVFGTRGQPVAGCPADGSLPSRGRSCTLKHWALVFNTTFIIPHQGKSPGVVAQQRLQGQRGRLLSMRQSAAASRGYMFLPPPQRMHTV